MGDRELIVTFSIVFIGLQFLFKILDARRNKEIIAAFKEGFSKFDAHASTSKENNSLLKMLDKAHSQVDADGRPLWYMPHSMIETQSELVKMSHTVAQTQKMICEMMKETRKDIEGIGEDIKVHAKECRDKT